MNNVPVRIGQQNSIKLITSISGGTAYSDQSNTSLNVIGGIASVSQLNVSGVSSLSQLNVRGISQFANDVYITGNLDITENLNSNNLNISGILSVNQSFYYPQGNPYGIAYFDSSDQLVSTSSTIFSISESNYVLTTNNLGIPSWTNSIDGGTY